MKERAASGSLAREGGIAADEPLSAETRLCVDVGASYVRVALADGSRVTQFVECRISELVTEFPDIVLAIADLIERVLSAPPSAWGGKLPPIGIGVPAIVFEDGTLRAGLSTGIPGGAALRDQISERIGTAVVVDNDAKMAALGESIYGAGKGERTVTLLTLGSNIGMGITVDGRIYRGAHGAAGEIGTVPVRLDKSDHLRWELVSAARQEHPGTLYPPGDFVGLEELYGGQALSNALRARKAASGLHESSTSTRVLQMAAAGDTIAHELVTEAIGGWALAIATISATLDPGVVLIGGGIAEDVGPFLDLLRRAVGELVPARAPRVEIASLASLAGLIGAGVAARHITST
jgi:predicted NBD/HSP70 family sugar kinase